MTKIPFYTTIENQIRQDDSKGLLYDHYTDYNQALAKYYTICAAAAVSDCQYHSAMLVLDDGTLKQEIFDRRESNTPSES